jgi:site-specific recombinase XerD
MDKKGFIKYMEGKDFAQRTKEGHLQNLQMFFLWAKAEDIQVTKPDILRYLEHLKNKGLQNVTRRRHLDSLKHYFTFLYKSGQTADNPCLFLKIRGTNRKTLHKIYSPEELDGLFDAYYQLFVRAYDDSRQRHDLQRRYSALSKERNALMLSVLVSQGATAPELDRMEVNDIDLIRATIKIRGGKHCADRVLPLKATQIGLFMNYLQKVRPQFMEYHAEESNKLFLPLVTTVRNRPENKEIYIYELLARQIRQIDKNFLNYTQIRASVITFWLKTQGLRKTQYMAGHRNISTTEAYLPNNYEDLANDINRLHPF